MNKWKNFGPCIVCGNQDPDIQYRRITTQTILKINKSPNIENLNIKPQVDDQLCQKHYNELILYERGKPKIDQKQKNKSYHQGGKHPKHICMEKYESLNKTLAETSKKLDELQEHTNEPEAGLEQALSYIIINYCQIIYIYL